MIENSLVHAALTHRILSSAMQVHAFLGPGLLESVYRACFVRQLDLDGLRIKEEVAISVSYKGINIDHGCRADVIVEDAVA